jgi:tyrosine-protein phosphatase YwqE
MKTVEMSILKRISVRPCIQYETQSAIQVHALEERRRDYKNKWHDHILRMDSSRSTTLKKNSVALVRKRTIPTERPPLSAK